MSDYVRPRCGRCDSSSIVVRKDNSYLCRRCGYDSRNSIVDKNEK